MDVPTDPVFDAA